MDQDSTRAPQRTHARTRSNISVASIQSRPKHLRSKSTKKVDSIYSDEATVAFIKRTLCAQHIRSGAGPDNAKGRNATQPLTELLPPLTSSNQIDLQVYALVSIIIKDFVQAWYSRITPDHEFTDQVVQIIAHCTRGLEQRIRSIDLETLILDELPELVDIHVTAYRTAHNGSYPSSLVANPRDVYHAIIPHPALSPVPLESGSPESLDQSENEAVWRQLLIQGALSNLLPPDDLANPCLRVLVTEIFSELILGKGICGNICEGWFIWDVLIKLLNILRRPTPEVQHSPISPTRLEKFGLLSDDEIEEKSITPPRRKLLEVMSAIFWQVMQYCFLVFLAVRACVNALSSSTSLPARTRRKENLMHVELDGLPRDQPKHGVTKRPILGMSIWSCCSHFLSLDLKMPWLTTMGAYIQWLLLYGPGRVGYTNGNLDRLLSHHFQTTILDPTRLPAILVLIRTNMFPNNSLGPGRVAPTAVEALDIRHRCAVAIAEAIPGFVRDRLFAATTITRKREVDDNDDGDDDDDGIGVNKQIEDMLDVFGDVYLNKHLIVSIVDLVFLRLFPELGEEGIAAMLNKAE